MQRCQPLDCDLHDFLEIACMHAYPLRVELVDGSEFQAQALTTRTTPSKEEFLQLRGTDGEREVRLDQLLAITPLSARALFGRVELGNRVCAVAP
ncbi:Rho-binding antiterminator [Pseudomonas turukhanskensis]|uniref:Transcriptional antiterminator n=1 Tax=Pseudomonas turukhanskensis TaxID=1806536 RepID=A0A9W6K585_9PSED|nr:Rho-binding antiterminator [Pseudomonas turukhanskensis]GLK89745.1 hypothetical protein GCM10017655_28070 [Pseudomonas turukhanskensis]